MGTTWEKEWNVPGFHFYILLQLFFSLTHHQYTNAHTSHNDTYSLKTVAPRSQLASRTPPSAPFHPPSKNRLHFVCFCLYPFLFWFFCFKIIIIRHIYIYIYIICSDFWNRFYSLLMRQDSRTNLCLLFSFPLSNANFFNIKLGVSCSIWTPIL